MQAQIPLMILTGFLGAGKTTLLNRVIAKPEFAGSALIINEIGDVAVDHHLVRESASRPVLLAGGCICCAYSKELGQVVRDLHERVRMGVIPPFRRVIVETTGLADPLPILERLATDAWVSAHFRVGPVITLADAEMMASGEPLLSEAVAQLAVADRIVLTKADLIDTADRAACIDRLAAINGEAPIAASARGDVAADFFLAPHAPAGMRLDRPLPAGAVASHSMGIATAAVELQGALPWAVVAEVLDRVTRECGPALLRLKGLIAVRNVRQTVAVHAVRGTFYPPELVDIGPAAAPSARIVLIGRDLDMSAIAAKLRADLMAGRTIAADEWETTE